MIRLDIQKLIEPAVLDLGYQIWACEYLTHGKLLRVYIDKETGIGIRDCELVSKTVATLLDVHNPIEGQYNLEISSPGIPRPLFYKEHYETHKGQKVKLKLYKPLEGGSKIISGWIETVHDDAICLRLESGLETLLFSQIAKATLIDE